MSEEKDLAKKMEDDKNERCIEIPEEHRWRQERVTDAVMDLLSTKHQYSMSVISSGLIKLAGTSAAIIGSFDPNRSHDLGYIAFIGAAWVAGSFIEGLSNINFQRERDNYNTTATEFDIWRYANDKEGYERKKVTKG